MLRAVCCDRRGIGPLLIAAVAACPPPWPADSDSPIFLSREQLVDINAPAPDLRWADRADSKKNYIFYDKLKQLALRRIKERYGKLTDHKRDRVVTMAKSCAALVWWELCRQAPTPPAATAAEAGGPSQASR